MKLGPRYKIAKRLGPIFEKTQTRQFALSKERSAKNKKGGRRGGSDYSRQLIEKQKMRLTYGLSEKQFSSYVKKALERKTPSVTLFKLLESRLDSVIYRMGLSGTRRMARQMVSHGHFTVNGVRTKVPSHRIASGDAISVRDGSRGSSMFGTVIVEKLKEFKSPSWVQFDIGSMEGKMATEPAFSEQDAAADIGAVFEYYTR